MNAFRVPLLILALPSLIAGGCTPQPLAMAQSDFDAEFTLMTTIQAGRMVFVGAGGEIDGVTNPELMAQPGDRIRVTLINDDGMPHDFAIPDLNAHTTMVTAKAQTTDVVIETSDSGEFAYYCTVSGHREAGMEGRLIVSEP